MTTKFLQITYSSRSSESSNDVKIMLEQEAWSYYTGVVTKVQFIKCLADKLYDKSPDAEQKGISDFGIDCGTTGNVVNAVVLAYPYEPDLNYALYATYGTLTGPSVEEKEKIETVLLKNQDNIEVKYPVMGIVSAEWIQDAYRKDGKQLEKISPNPEILVGDDLKTIKAATKCYGSVKVTYQTMVHTYFLNIPKRESAEENKYSSVVYAIYTGKPVWLGIEPPPGAEESEGDCSKTSIVDPQPPSRPQGLPEEPSGDLVFNYEYCSGELKNWYTTGD